jgi:hypothetical protein
VTVTLLNMVSRCYTAVTVMTGNENQFEGRDQISQSHLTAIKVILDFRLSPCFECRIFAFGLFPGVCSLNANVSEHFVRSIFIGEYVRSDSGGEI